MGVLDGRYTGWGPQIHQIHCVSARASDTLDTHLISKSLVTVRYTGYTGVSGPVSDTLDTHLPSRTLTEPASALPAPLVRRRAPPSPSQ